MKVTETYTSCMHVHVRFHIYQPKVILRIKGVVQIHHGFGEHADRYDHFASFLLNHGFVVVVSDFVGHGQSLIDFEQGYFGDSAGPENIMKDMLHLYNVIRMRYPEAPYFMLGVDIGSLFIRKFVSLYGDFVDGILLLGTLARINHKYIQSGYLSLMKTIKGPSSKAQQLFTYLHKNWNKKIAQTGEFDWLTSDNEELQRFLKDPMTHFAYTIQGYKDIIRTVNEVNSDESIAKIPVYLPIYIAEGELDPLAKGVEKLVEKYKNAKIRDLTYHVFEERRHALLFEKNKQEIYFDILNWLEERTYL